MTLLKGGVLKMELLIGENIRLLRKKHGLTQEQLAETLGVTPGAVYKWEAKLSVPDISLILELANFFDISVDAIENVEYEPVIINAPAIGDYKIVMDTTAAGGSVLYFDGTLNSKGALNSTDKASKATNVTVAAVEGKEGVYTLNVNGKYLVGYLNGTFNNMKLADEPGEWTWNTELKTFVCTFADKDGKQSTFYFGTYVKENVSIN